MTDQPTPAPGSAPGNTPSDHLDPTASPAKKGPSSWLIPALLGVLIAVFILKPILSPEVVHLDETTWRYDVQAAMADATAGEKPILALFTADWCGGCQVLKQEVFAQEAIASTLPEQVLPVYVDLSDPPAGSPEDTMRMRYDVQMLPTTVLLTPEGMELGRFVGPKSPDGFNEWLSKAIAGPNISFTN